MNESWDDHFAIPGDIGQLGTCRQMRVRASRPSLGSVMKQSGVFYEDDSGRYRGLFTNDEHAVIALCALLVPSRDGGRGSTEMTTRVGLSDDANELQMALASDVAFEAW